MGFTSDKLGIVVEDDVFRTMTANRMPDRVVEWPIFTGKTFLAWNELLLIARFKGAAGGDTPMEFEEAWEYVTTFGYEREWSEIVLLPMSVALKKPKD